MFVFTVLIIQHITKERRKMGGFDYNHFSADFANRTASNLNLVYRVANFQRNREANSEDCILDKEQIPNYLKRLISIVDDEKCEGFEITQLLLSLYGMLLVPYEKYKNDPNIAKATIQDGLQQTKEHEKLNNKIKELRDDDRYRSTYLIDNQDYVYSFIQHLRNSISHEGIHFLPLTSGQTEQIKEIIFYDFNAYNDNGYKQYKRFRDAREQFCVRLKKEELKEIVKTIAEMYSKIKEDFDAGDMERYKQEKKDCEDFLEKKF